MKYVWEYCVAAMVYFTELNVVCVRVGNGKCLMHRIKPKNKHKINSRTSLQIIVS